ncbi:uncharacterized protein Z519_11148 [Cladophialophora bantiana CBS 173.52]|uniref:NADP-dependent oxidoreductase domain-containing protein n=1 Tax=Cladophialophora bantiana (strain ATCC 10958 / CBS 173.52 / CDC B-1940 / NIH 8579) TaxID=1442370 RepID=A0A0D2H453_CLAB1|nr:uncharacterized protein Z519_11148 [Cladophialophora bantiana CBS 173.52]KIW88038.1 hypothetical protein Z519_11148 [Cladophialophora bantiana CBS 173.52]
MPELQITSTLPLKSGHEIPVLGFGTCQSETCTQSALFALKHSYRHLDTAQIYKNEAETGAAIAQSQIDPSKLFVCSKLWDDMYSRQGALAGVQGSLKKLGLESIDLYLLHTPRPGPLARKEAWLGLQDAVERGLVKSIGVSNWAPKHIEQLMTEEGVYIEPVCNQIELHPWNQQRQLVSYCKGKGIVVVAYSPLTQGRRLNDETIVSLAQKYGKTPAQIVLRWGLQKGLVVIPKSDRETRIIENQQIFGWEISHEDTEVIDGLDEGQKANLGEWDPYAWD